MFNKKNKKIELIPKLLITFFIIIACVQTVSALALFNSPEFVLAGGSSGGFDDVTGVSYQLQTQIGDETKIDFTEYTTKPIADYIKIIYRYAIGAVGIISAVVLMVGGVIWLTAGGNTSKVQEAKEWIGASLTGLVLVLCSYIIFNQINPDLVNFKLTPIRNLANIEEEEGGVTSIAYSGCDWVEDIKCPEKRIKVDGKCDPNTQPTFEQKIAGKYFYKPTGICCCDELGYDQWIYDPGISPQIGDASKPLINLLECMRKEISDPSIGRISSISDSAGLEKCKTDYAKPPCAHSKNSCHYGGKEPDMLKSLAVDFGDERNYATIKKAAENCPGGKSILLEKNPAHIHISLSSCRGNIND